MRKVRVLIVFLSFCLCGCASTPFKVEPLNAGPFAKKLNLVFVPLNYQAHKDFLKDRETLALRLEKAVPFNEFPEAVKIWDLEIAEKKARKVFLPQEAFPPLRVDPGFLEKVFLRIGANYKLILLDKTGSTDCSELSSLEATSVIIVGRQRFSEEPSSPSGFLHELGHSLGLRDESPFSSQPIVPGPPNCAPDQKTAELWWGDMTNKGDGVSYYPLKSGQNHFLKPTLHSVMENPYRFNDFGPVNERYLRKVLERYRDG